MDLELQNNSFCRFAVLILSRYLILVLLFSLKMLALTFLFMVWTTGVLVEKFFLKRQQLFLYFDDEGTLRKLNTRLRLNVICYYSLRNLIF